MSPRCKALLCSALVLLALAPRTSAEENPSAALERARRARLWEHPSWRALLHYKPRLLLPGVKSQVDAESFFLSPHGKTDPEAELEATLSSFFAAPASSDESQDSRCTFPARYEWLKEVLDFRSTELRGPACTRLEGWLSKLDPAGLTLVFAGSYLNNPASMFGHTLLRLDPPSSDRRTPLLAYTVGFAAETRRARGPGYAFKGLTGGYPGKLSVAPYYVKVKAYGDIENRDLWEYRLDLTPAEVRRLALHVWELAPAHFDYFFLDENCAYHLLGLIEVARPEVHPTDDFPLWVIPSDTVRALTRLPGLVRGVEFRPSRRTVVERRALSIDPPLQELAARLGEARADLEAAGLTQLSPVEQARVLELAAEYRAYREASDSHAEGAGGDPRQLELLEARSRLDVPPQTPAVETPRVRPDSGHRSARAGLSHGYEARAGFMQLELRPGYHDLLDPPGGYVRGGELRFLEAAFRHYPRRNRLELEGLDLASITSVAERDRFVRPISWEASGGLVRRRFSGGERDVTARILGGAGLSRRASPQTLVSLFAEGEALVSPSVPGLVAPGLGARLGLVRQGEEWSASLSARAAEFLLREPRYTYDLTFGTRLRLSGRASLRLDLWRRLEFDEPADGGLLGLLVYF